MLLSKSYPKIILLFLVVIWTDIYSLSQTVKTTEKEQIEIDLFIDLIHTKDTLRQNQLLTHIAGNWKEEYEIMVLELAYLNAHNQLGGQLMDLINEKTGKYLGYSINTWYEYLWSKDEKTLPNYDYFKAELYKTIDNRFKRYFINRSNTSTIRFDEIRWGGVKQDGIPPLRNPEMIDVDQAGYLSDHHIVFGIAINGEFRAYPKRILAWHEMFTETIGGEPVTGVYCTLCGTVIAYKSTKDSITYNLGTSGFLYRSNKLMYDRNTQSLWNTLWGIPVVGPLAGKGIQLDYISVVTTTWGEWKKLHPTTQVLSLNTGYKKDYGEGVAYQNYFANDQLMFSVPESEQKKIKNKQSVLAIRLQDNPRVQPVAISVKFLKKHPVYHYQISNTNLLILTDKTGANRVYEIGDRHFTKYNQAQNNVVDDQGNQWTLHENHLKNKQGERLNRFQTFNAFWFGWQAAYPNTILIK